MSVLFNLCIVTKSLTESSTPISAVLEIRSRANLPCLVKLALRFQIIAVLLNFIFIKESWKQNISQFPQKY